MHEIFRANIGDVAYALDLETMEITTGTVEGVVRTDKQRNYYKAVVSFPATKDRSYYQAELLVDEHSLYTSLNKIFYSINLKFVQDKKVVLRAELEKKLLKEIADRVKILRRIGTNDGTVKAKISGCFGVSSKACVNKDKQ